MAIRYRSLVAIVMACICSGCVMEARRFYNVVNNNLDNTYAVASLDGKPLMTEDGKLPQTLLPHQPTRLYYPPGYWPYGRTVQVIFNVYRVSDNTYHHYNVVDVRFPDWPEHCEIIYSNLGLIILNFNGAVNPQDP